MLGCVESLSYDIFVNYFFLTLKNTKFPGVPLFKGLVFL